MRLLVISHTFPPSVISNAKRPFYVVRDLLQAGWEVDVFTTRLGVRAGQCETVVHPGLRIYRPHDALINLFDKSLSRRLARLPVLLINAFIWPDNFLFWSRKAVRWACAEKTRYERVLAYVLPASVLLAGRRPDLVDRKWVFDYQESVTPYQQDHPRRSLIQRSLLGRTIDLERHTLKRAGKVIFTAETNRDAYIRSGLVRPEATAHIPYFFDAKAFADPVPPVPNRFDIAYFGNFDWRGERNPETFLRGFAGFLRRHPEARERSRFVFYGSWLQEHNRYIEELNLGDVVSINRAVAYDDYLEGLKKSPILLLVVSAAHNLFMPSKIVDYFGARRPILAFVHRRSEMRRVLEAAGMAEFACDEFDVEAGVAALERLWQQFQKGTLGIDAAKSTFWSSDTQMGRYRAVLQGSD